MIYNNIGRFADERDAFVNTFRSICQSLFQQRESTYKIAKWLDQLAYEFDLFKIIAETERVSRCFRMKCDLIKHTIQDTSDILKTRPNSEREVAEMLDMIATHIGRLTLSRRKGVDLYAENMNRLAEETNTQWQTRRRAASPATERKQRGLHEIWVRLHLTVPGCVCLQCVRGQGSNIPR